MSRSGCAIMVLPLLGCWAAGCDLTYTVRREALIGADLSSRSGRAPVLPAERADGTRVLLRAEHLTDVSSLGEPSAASHLHLADELQRAGQHQSAARQLKSFLLQHRARLARVPRLSGRARELFNAGLEALTQGRWQDAVDAFSSSSRLTPAAITYLHLADAELRAGMSSAAVTALRWCVESLPADARDDRYTILAVIRTLDAGATQISSLDTLPLSPELRQPVEGSSGDDLVEVERAIAVLEDGDARSVSIPRLRLAAAYPAADSGRISVRPRNGLMAAAKVLGLVSLSSGIASLLSFAAIPATGPLPVIAGWSFTGGGIITGLTSMFLALGGRHAAETDHEPDWLNPRRLFADRARRRRELIGSSVGLGLTMGVAVAGGILLDTSYRISDSNVDSRRRTTLSTSSLTLLPLGVLGVVATLPPVIVAAVRYARLRRSVGAPRSTQASPPLVTPWLAGNGGGLAILGTIP